MQKGQYLKDPQVIIKNIIPKQSSRKAQDGIVNVYVCVCVCTKVQNKRENLNSPTTVKF